MGITPDSTGFTQLDVSPFQQLGLALRNLTHQMPKEITVPLPEERDPKLTSYLMAHVELKKALERQREDPTLTEMIVQEVGKVLGSSPMVDLYLISYLYKLNPKLENLKVVLNMVDQCELEIGPLHQVYWYLRQSLYGTGTMVDAESFELLFRFYLSLSQIWRSHSMTAVGEWIPPEARNADRVVVLTNQFLELPHGPTADVYETIRALRAMGKEVLLVNTADMPNSKTVPMFDPKVAPYAHDLIAAEQITYRDATYSFKQCPPNMPNVTAALQLVKQIRQLKPELIISLGGSSPVADLCAGFTTVATIPFDGVFPIAASQLLFIPRVCHTQDRTMIARLGFHEDVLFSNQYAFAPQTPLPSVKRASLGIPKNATAFCLVGSQFEPELSSGFLAMLNEACRSEPRLFIVFMGEFDIADMHLSSMPFLQERSCFVGQRDDQMAVLAACDGYLNPPRQGGATSAVAAMTAGLPILSQGWGDVVDQACDNGTYERWVNAKQISGFAKQLADDPGLAKTLSRRSKKRAAECTDRSAMLKNLIEHLEDGMLDQNAVFSS